MANSRALRGELAIVIAALLWSTGGVGIKTVSLDAFSVSLWRSGFAVVTLYVLYRANRKRIEPSDREPWLSGHLLLTAFVFALLLVLFVIATKLTTSANAIFLQYTAPIYVLFFEPILSRTKMHPRDILPVIICTSAMGLFFIGKFDMHSFWGNIAALASGLAFAAFALLLKHERASEALRWKSVIVGHVMIVVAMAVLTLLGVTSPLPHNGGEFATLAYLGIVQIGVAYGLFTFGIGHVRAIDATLISMIEPVLNPIWVYFGTGETPTGWAIIGGAIILGVVAVRTISASSRKLSL